MLRLLLLCVLSQPVWAVDPTKTLIVGRGTAGNAVAVFDHGYLLFTPDSSSAVEIWGPDGLQHFFGTVDKPYGAHVYSIAVDSDGSAAASVVGFNGSEISEGIAYFDSTGMQSRFVDTGRYMPSHLSFDKNHSLWAFGWMRNAASDREERSDYMMFRKYSGDGTEEGRYGRRSILSARGLDPGYVAIGGWHLKAIGDRIGALVSYRANSSDLVWIELALDDGHLMGMWPLGRDLNGGMAFTGDAKLCRQVPAKTMPGIECLDRSTGRWKHTGDAPVPGVLLGADEDQLVFQRNEGVIHLYWVRP
jgi:hypothetical protein